MPVNAIPVSSLTALSAYANASLSSAYAAFSLMTKADAQGVAMMQGWRGVRIEMRHYN